jgi:hypothetical protein
MKLNRNHAVFIGTLAALAIGAAIWAMIPTSGASGSRVPQAWPAFDMTYKITAHLDTGTGQRSYQVWQLRYDSDSSWEQQLVGDTEYPARVGSVQSFDGTTRRYYNALANTTREDKSTDGTLTAPGEWFVPRSRAVLLKKGYVATDSAGNTYHKADRVACPTELDGNSGQIACGSDGRVEMDTDITLDEHGVPLRVETSVAGTPTSSFEALDFHAR